MTFFLKWIAPTLALLVVVGAIYGKGRLDSAHKAGVAQVTKELALTKLQLQTEQNARAIDAATAKTDATKVNQLNTKIDGLNAYVDALEDANRQCLSGADSNQLRQLWR